MLKMIDPEDIVSDVYKRNTKVLFKSFLILIEDTFLRDGLKSLGYGALSGI